VLLDAKDGWTEVDIVITAAEVPELGQGTIRLPFHHMDMSQF
jgi:hypothetical protein